MKRVILIVILIGIVITACSPSETAIQTASTQTQTALPTTMPEPTATLIPFSEFDLEDILIQANDLPAGYLGGQASNTTLRMLDDIQNADYIISQQIQKDDYEAGDVTVFLFELEVDVTKAYEEILKLLPEDAKSVDGEWDVGALYILSLETPTVFDSIAMVFSRCHAVVSIRIDFSKNENDILSYAKQLLERLQPFVCR